MTDETQAAEAADETEQSLTEVLREKGFTHKQVPGTTSGQHNVRKAAGGKQHIVFTGDSAEVWIWVEQGCPYELPAEPEADGELDAGQEADDLLPDAMADQE